MIPVAFLAGVNWLRVGAIAAVVAIPVGAFLYGKHRGWEDRETVAEMADEQARVVYLSRVIALNADISDIKAKYEAKLATARANGKNTTKSIQEKTDANPATPDTACRIDDGAYQLLLDAFRESAR